MKLLVVSDLHLEFGRSFTLPKGLDYDVVVLAGDIDSPGTRAVQWAALESTFGGRSVVYVPGNHEFYSQEMGAELEQMRNEAAGTNVSILNRDSVVVVGVRFLGATLWTDFALPVGTDSKLDDYTEDADVARALATANKRVEDFRAIRLADHAIPRHRGEAAKQRLLTAEDTLAMHQVDRDWLRRQLAKPFDGPTVVVTHHAPASGSVAERYAADWLTPAFVSDLPDTLFDVPALWVHGHTHASFDYRRGACRVVSNPRGYRMRDGSFENHKFQAGLVVKVGNEGRPPSLDKFHARAQASLEEYQRTGTSYSEDEVLARLQAQVDARRRQLSEKLGLSPNEQKALQDPDVSHGFEHYDELLLEGRRLRGERLEAADMVSVAEAAAIAGRSTEDIEASVERGECLGIADEAGTLRLPKWQFESAYNGIWKRLADALGSTDAWVLLTALETPLGALGGITPRVAIERGQAERAFAVVGD